jgi:hypothetical protein
MGQFNEGEIYNFINKKLWAEAWRGDMKEPNKYLNIELN